MAGPNPRALAWRLPWVAYPAHPRRRKVRGTYLESEGAPAAIAPHSCCFATRGEISRLSMGESARRTGFKRTSAWGLSGLNDGAYQRPGLLFGVNSHVRKLGADVWFAVMSNTHKKRPQTKIPEGRLDPCLSCNTLRCSDPIKYEDKNTPKNPCPPLRVVQGASLG